MKDTIIENELDDAVQLTQELIKRFREDGVSPIRGIMAMAIGISYTIDTQAKGEAEKVKLRKMVDLVLDLIVKEVEEVR